MIAKFKRNEFNFFKRLFCDSEKIHDPDSVEKFNESCEELDKDGKPKRNIKRYPRFRDGQQSDFMNLAKIRNLIDAKFESFQDSKEIRENIEEAIQDFELTKEQKKVLLDIYEELEKAVGVKIIPEEIEISFADYLIPTIQKYLAHYERLQVWPETYYWSIRMKFEEEKSDALKIWDAGDHLAQNKEDDIILLADEN